MDRIGQDMTGIDIKQMNVERRNDWSTCRGKSVVYIIH